MPETEPTLALSVPQPWAFAILNGGKNVENRNWKTPFRGRIWIHAPKTEWIDDIKYCLARVAVQKRISLDAAKARYTEQRKFSAILGSVELYRIDRLDELKPDDPVLTNHWANGPFLWMLREPETCTPRPMPGQRRLWKPTGVRS